MKYCTLDEICITLEKYENILITSHVNPDGDSYGSTLSLFLFLNQLNKNPRLIFFNDIPENYKYLDGLENLEIYDSNLHDKFIEECDLIIVADVNDPKRTKSLENPIRNSNAYKIVIDHHLEPQPFADQYFVDTDACSTGELVYKIITSFNNQFITPAIANALYVAIMTDTGSFRFPRTDSEVFMIISRLLQYGADPVKNYEEVYNQSSLSATKLLGLAYTKIEMHYNNLLCIIVLSDDDFKSVNAIEEDNEGIVEKTMALKGVKVGIFISELKHRNEIRISLRSKDQYNVREYASTIGGGGHLNASGARVPLQNLDDLKNKIIKDLAYMF